MSTDRTAARIKHPTDPDGIALHLPDAAPPGNDDGPQAYVDADGVPTHFPEADPFTIPEASYPPGYPGPCPDGMDWSRWLAANNVD